MELEDQYRFTVEADVIVSERRPILTLVCDRCGIDAELDGNLSLAELNRRAGEHAEVCR